MVLFGFLLPFAFVAGSLAASPPKESPSQPDDLICHTDNPAECYPRVFQPTEEFQIVHEDQEIPNGLHVRLDISTGKREAKINNPDEQNPALEGLPVDKGIVTVETEGEAAADEPLFLNGAPVYESFGKVKPPPDHETGEFFSNLDFIRKGPGGKDLPFDEALEFLEDISHDIFYGSKIAETPATVQALLCLMVDEPFAAATPAAPGDDVKPRGQQAASIIAAALQNNPTAASDVGNAWASLMDSTCPSSPGGKKLRTSLYDSFMPRGALDESAVPAMAARAKAHVSAFNSLLRSADVRRDFLAHGGMDRLVETLAPTVAEWESVQRKVGHLLLDNFLDEELGAVTGDWPVFRAGEKDSIARRAARAADERWIEALRWVRDRNDGKKSHWSVDVLARLEKLHQKQMNLLPKDEL